MGLLTSCLVMHPPCSDKALCRCSFSSVGMLRYDWLKIAEMLVFEPCSSSLCHGEYTGELDILNSELLLRVGKLMYMGNESIVNEFHNNICSRGGRRDWYPLRQPGFLTKEVPHWGTIQMVTPPDIMPVLQDLTSVNRRKLVFSFGYSRKSLGKRRMSLSFKSFCKAVSVWRICNRW